MVLTLFVVTFVSATILGFVHSLTKDAIEAAKVKAQNEAIKSILPAFTALGESVKIAAEGTNDSLVVFPAYDAQQQLVGMAIKSYTKNGFGGLIDVMIGFKPDGEISGYQVLEHKETPGLGSKAQAWFSNADKPGQNIIGKNPATTDMHVSKDGGAVDAITASTITSRAFLESVRRAYDTFKAAAQAKQEQPAATTEQVSEGGEL
ncbi:electron transport complex protein RnfG [Mangrovibacterium marinum]|uniref:Electron transport complex protein RnfG n=2 Tax=Mangrovibacterium marinum TaxID=1639118 RepID=A0A2T5BY24_9BACT|nr:RnfABCDGE type electron transport complex subunit G [Mangrovibacterium marinum]PTN06333.1 electron transport complex protein RnfG [Mangrovibacterium marinum]